MDYFCRRCWSCASVVFVDNIARCLECNGEVIKERDPADRHSRANRNATEVVQGVFPVVVRPVEEIEQQAVNISPPVMNAVPDAYSRVPANATSNVRHQTQSSRDLLNRIRRNAGTRRNALVRSGAMNPSFLRAPDHSAVSVISERVPRGEARQPASNVSKVVSPEDIVNLPETRVSIRKTKNGAECSICMEAFIARELVARLDCLHMFHRACVMPWLLRSKHLSNLSSSS
uniref:RING-type domain-containing protein n=1 Tax=Ditylenchus dipsaci TaxID=166011 RepID=A0A915CLY6_9BILA